MFAACGVVCRAFHMKGRAIMTYTFRAICAAFAIGLVCLACGQPAPQTPTASATLNLHRLPLGDGKLSNVAQVGSVQACQTTFGNAPGAFKEGGWIQPNGTWDATQKIAVAGAVRWPDAAYSVSVNGGARIITTASLPVQEATGVFPIAATDSAYQYDRNPNRIAPQSFRFGLPAMPAVAPSPTCLGLGIIGVLRDGVVLFNALDAQGRDAVAHEIQDACNGHPEITNVYHHHSVSACLLRTPANSAVLVGYALDGFGIYVERDGAGNLPTNADLDACHGRVSAVRWDDTDVTIYHYVASQEYPYTLGCFRGKPITPPGNPPPPH